MARNLSRRRVLTHTDFMRFGGLEPTKTKRSRGKQPSPAKIRREVDALIGARCGCSVNALEADSDKFACPCGPHCTDAECVAENKRRRSGLRKRHHEAKPAGARSRRWIHKDVARSLDVPEDVVRRIYGAVQLAKKQGLHGGYMADLIERSVGRRLLGNEYKVAARAKDSLGYRPEGGYGGPEPRGAAVPPPRAHGDDRRVREADQIANKAERIITDVINHADPLFQYVGGRVANETQLRERLRQAADELDVAADLYEDAGATLRAGTVHHRARLAREGAYRKLAVYHMTKKTPAAKARRRRR